MNHKIPVLLLAISLASCGPSAQEIAEKRKQHDDSVAVATAAKIAERQKMQDQLTQLQQQYDKLKADLVVANDEMSRLKEFHLMRTDAERSQQLENQSLKISHLQEAMQQIQGNISRLNLQSPN